MVDGVFHLGEREGGVVKRARERRRAREKSKRQRRRRPRAQQRPTKQSPHISSVCGPALHALSASTWFPAAACSAPATNKTCGSRAAPARSPSRHSDRVVRAASEVTAPPRACAKSLTARRPMGAVSGISLMTSCLWGCFVFQWRLGVSARGGASDNADDDARDAAALVYQARAQPQRPTAAPLSLTHVVAAELDVGAVDVGVLLDLHGPAQPLDVAGLVDRGVVRADEVVVAQHEERVPHGRCWLLLLRPARGARAARRAR